MPHNAIVIGAGPNGLAAAIELARAGYLVQVYEANDTIGGGVRSAELTLPGFVHDICSAVHPLAAGSPFFSQLPLARYELEYINPPAAMAHPFDDGTAVLLHRSVELTAEGLGRDGSAYRQLIGPLVNDWDLLAEDLLSPPGIPRHPIKLAQFGFYGIRSAKGLTQGLFTEERTRAFFAGLAAHSFLSLDMLASAAFALVMATIGHAIGWPITRGGSQRIANALTSYLRDLGAKVLTGVRIDSIDQLPDSRIIMCDVTPRQLLKIAGTRFPSTFRNKLKRYRYGPAAFKIDWALRGPVPWKAEGCTQAATVHLGCSFEEIYASEKACWQNEYVERPFVIVSQPNLFDPARAPEGRHTLWGYCHVPNGSRVDMTEVIENQIERFAPGFRDQILTKHVMSPADLEKHNPNLVGGDINGGAQDLGQMFTRPTMSLYSTPVKGLYICSSSTPPGGGVHGMCGYNAARAAIHHVGRGNDSQGQIGCANDRKGK
jgi:phytoene dehydrogenase-like protein